MKQIDYTSILRQRSLLPRRDDLYKAIKKYENQLVTLESKYTSEKTSIEEELFRLKLAKESYSFSREEMEFMGRADSVSAVCTTRELRSSPTTNDISGIYEILLNGKSCYVGESSGIRNRLCIHAGSIINWRNATHEMYSEIAKAGLENIDFAIIEVTAAPDNFKGTDKQWRLLREAYFGYMRLDEGFNLFNKTFAHSRATIESIFNVQSV